MTVPAWVWAASAAALIAVVTAEVMLARHSGHGSVMVRRAVRWVAVYMSLAVIFGLGGGVAVCRVAAGQFYAGYLTEYSLSLDNLFIFYVIMSSFAVPPARQQRVLLAGVGLALVLRSIGWPASKPLTNSVSAHDSANWPGLDGPAMWMASARSAAGPQLTGRG